MDAHQLIIFGIFIALIGALVFTEVRPVVSFSLALVVLIATNTISLEEALNNATNTGVVTLLLILLSSAAIEKTRILKKAGRHLITACHSTSLLRIYITTGLASAFLNNTAVVATLISTVTSNPYHSASRLLIPLSYAAILGGTTTLIGTSTNLIINSLLLAEGETPFGFFDFAIFGFSVFVVCGILLFFLSPLFPTHKEEEKPSKAYFIETEVEKNSPLCGKSITESKLRNLGTLFLVEIVRKGAMVSPVSPGEIIQPEDKLIFSGDVNDIHQLDQFKGLTTFAGSNGLLQQNLKEVVISNQSILVGKTLKMVGFRSLFDAAVVAIHRGGEQLSAKFGNINLRPGDNLILAIGDDFLTRKNLHKNFFIVSETNFPKKLSGKQEVVVISGFVVAIFASILGLVPLFESVFYYLAMLTLTKSLSASEIKQHLPLDLWLIIVSALSLATALDHSGFLAKLSSWVSLHIDNFSPMWALIFVYLFTLTLTELVTNNAAAALSFPIAYGIAQGLEANMATFIMAVAMGASASFITPYGYQTNLMVFNTGRYHMLDFCRVGLPISVLYSLTVLILLPIVLPIRN